MLTDHNTNNHSLLCTMYFTTILLFIILHPTLSNTDSSNEFENNNEQYATCADYMQNSTLNSLTNGIYPITNITHNNLTTLDVYCVFDYDNRYAWTLIESGSFLNMRIPGPLWHSLANNAPYNMHDISLSGVLNDLNYYDQYNQTNYSINNNYNWNDYNSSNFTDFDSIFDNYDEYPINGTLYRLSHSWMSHIYSHSQFMLSTCNYMVNFSQDWMLLDLNTIEYHPLYDTFGPACMTVHGINIRGYYCDSGTSVRVFSRDSSSGGGLDSESSELDRETHFRVDSYNSGTVPCTAGDRISCTIIATNAVESEDNFGYYNDYNELFGCSKSDNSTTNWWLGIKIDTIITYDPTIIPTAPTNPPSGSTMEPTVVPTLQPSIIITPSLQPSDEPSESGVLINDIYKSTVAINSGIGGNGTDMDGNNSDKVENNSGFDSLTALIVILGSVLMFFVVLGVVGGRMYCGKKKHNKKMKRLSVVHAKLQADPEYNDVESVTPGAGGDGGGAGGDGDSNIDYANDDSEYNYNNSLKVIEEKEKDMIERKTIEGIQDGIRNENENENENERGAEGKSPHINNTTNTTFGNTSDTESSSSSSSDVGLIKINDGNDAIEEVANVGVSIIGYADGSDEKKNNNDV